MRILRETSERNRAFTLIELLVVVAIIALLLSILLPSLQRARESAKQLLCLTNQRTMGQAAFLYAEDNEEWVVRSESFFTSNRNGNWGMHFAASLLPGLGYTGQEGPIVTLWDQNDRGRLRRACKANELFQCPSFPNEDQPLDYVVSAFHVPLPRRFVDDPGQPGDDVSDNQDGRAVQFSKLGDFELYRPGDIIHIAEANQNIPGKLRDPEAPWGNFHDVFSTQHLPFARVPRVSNDNRHPGGTNALFFDGHATTMAFSSIDAGFPNPVEIRARWFTQILED